MASKPGGKRRGNPAALPPLVHKMLKEGRLEALAAYANKHYGLSLDVAEGPEAMKAAIVEIVRARAAEKARQQAEQQAEQEPEQGPETPAQPVIAKTAAEIEEERRKAEIASLPKDPWVTAGRKPGKPQPVSGVYNDEGVLLPPDTDPVLSDEEYQAELRLTNPEFTRRLDDETLKAMEKMPEHLRPKPVKPPFRHSTKPGIPKAFLNQETGVFWRPTELLMRNPRLTPIYDEPPIDAVYGT